jgi:hypothetical protein
VAENYTTRHHVTVSFKVSLEWDDTESSLYLLETIGKSIKDLESKISYHFTEGMQAGEVSCQILEPCIRITEVGPTPPHTGCAEEEKH